MLWLILGIVIGAGILYLATRPGVTLRWYDWVLAVVALILALLAIQNYLASLAELETRAAVVLLAAFGVPAIILIVIVGLRIWRSSTRKPA